MSDTYTSFVEPLTLRDRLAIAALREVMTNKSFELVEPSHAAELAYQYADAMLAARESRQP